MDRFGFKRTFVLFAIAGASACGSRSQLLGPAAEDTGGTGGTGGAGGAGGTGATTSSSTTSGPTTSTSTTTSSTGGGGTGGLFPVACEKLEYATPFSDLDGGVMAHQRSPALSYSSDDAMRVTLASAWQAANQGPNAPSDLRHTTFDPWIDFPAGSGFGPTYLANLDGGVSFAAAQSPGNRLALLFRDFEEPPMGGLRFSADFTPKSGDLPPTFLADTNAGGALFLTYNGARWGFGAIDPQGGGGQFETRFGVVNDDFVEMELPLACTTERNVADAVGVEGGFLVAFGASTVPGEGCDFGIPSVPQGPHAMRVQGDQIFDVITFGSGQIDDLQMAPRQNGAWLVWRDVTSVNEAPMLWITSFDQEGNLLVDPFPYDLQCEKGSLAAAGFEDFLAIACILPEPEGGSPFVQVFNPEGAPVGGIKVAATGAALGRPSLIGSPITRSVVLAWSETAGVGDQIRITRVDCID
jgi:hypothetical protein